MKKIPQDPIICLELLCDDFMVDRDELIKKLADAGFSYDREQNRFR